MRIKRIAAMTALFLLTAAFVCSLNVFAAPVEETTAPAPSVPVATQSTQSTEPAAPTMPPGAFTPDGQGSVLDYVENENDEKLFYTITTKSGNVFYLVVDGARGEENVYFLNAVTESDLMALAEENNKTSVSGIAAVQTCTCTEKCKSGKVNEDCSVCKNDVGKCEGKSVSTDDEPQGGKSEKDGGSNITMYVIIGAAFIAVAGIGIYVKVIRPKKQQPEFDDDEGEDYGETDGADDYGEPDYLPEDDDYTDES